MNILIINPGKEYGGAEIYTQHLVVELQKRGHSVYLALNGNGEMAKRFDSANILFLGCNYKSIINDCYKIKKYTYKNKIDMIHCNGKNAMMLALPVLSCPKVAVIHGDILMDYKNKRYLKYMHFIMELFLVRLYKTVVAVSEPLQKLLSLRYCKKIFYVNNGIEYINYKDYADPYDKTLKICSVGRLTEIKNYDVILDAFLILKEKGMNHIKCDIFGDGEKKESLQKKIEIMDLKNVKLCGFKSNVRDRLNEYNVYIQPSIYESFGLAALEAYNAGCYVVANKVGGLEYIVNKIGHGCLLSECTKDEIARILQDLDANRKVLEKDKASYDDMKIFTSSYFVEEMENVYRKALKCISI